MVGNSSVIRWALTVVSFAAVAAATMQAQQPTLSPPMTMTEGAFENPSVNLDEESAKNVSVQDVQKMLLQKQLGNVEGLVGRISICSADRFSQVIGLPPEKNEELKTILHRIEASLLEQVGEHAAKTFAKEQGDDGGRDANSEARSREKTARSRTKPKAGLDALIANVKEQILFAETELEGLLTATQYRKMLAIQTHILDVKSVADPVVAKFCGVSDRELQSIRRLKKGMDRDIAKFATHARLHSETEAFMDYLNRADQFEGELW
ncbi:MAG: hypothetical protein AAF989_10700, partial [Planctomycetota bacterium]